MTLYVLKSIDNKGNEVFLKEFSSCECPIDGKLSCTKLFTFQKAMKMCEKINSLVRTMPNFNESWLYKVVAFA